MYYNRGSAKVHVHVCFFVVYRYDNHGHLCDHMAALYLLVGVSAKFPFSTAVEEIEKLLCTHNLLLPASRTVVGRLLLYIIHT